MDLPTLRRPALAGEDLDVACREWGVFALVEHGIDVALIDAFHADMVRFFALPTQTKNAIRRTETNSWGFYDAELTKQVRDWKEILDIGEAADTGPLAGSYPQWPDLAGFKDTMLGMREAMHDIALDVVEAIGETLATPIDVASQFGAHSSYLRLNYYPPCPTPAAPTAELASPGAPLGISRHTDAGAVTVLLQDDQAGLQVWKDDAWHLVPVVDDALIINIGDIVQVWSNDRYPAPLHRVLANASQPRSACPTFLNPSYD